MLSKPLTRKPRKRSASDRRSKRKVINKIVENDLIRRVSFEEYRDKVRDVYDGIELAGLDRVLAPIGGGGLIAGVATAVRGLQPSAAVIGVEPANGADTLESLRAGQLVNIGEPPTISSNMKARLTCSRSTTFSS